MTRRVAVIGGGLAGITAALRCADAGREVTLFEARPELGGLTRSFRRGPLFVDNGQHVFLRCCTAYRGLLDRLGVSDLVHIQPRLRIGVRMPGRAAAMSLQRSDLPAPLHLLGTLLRYSALGPADRARALRAALALRRVDPADDAVDQRSFGAWLDAHGQNPRLISGLWDLFTVASLNAPAERASLALAATVFQTGLLTDTAAGDIGWSRVPLQQLHGDAAARSLALAGTRLRTGTKVDGLRAGGAGWEVSERGAGWQSFEQVVLAVPPGTTESLLPAGSVALPPGWSARLGSAPIVNVHLIFDRVVLDQPFMAGVGTPIQWAFDRTEQSGLAAGQYVAVSLSAATDSIGQTTAQLRGRLLPALADLLPGVRRAEVLDFFVTRERHATFDPAPGTGRSRPPARTGGAGLVLAGAWTATGWPATMESAVLSGNTAAAALLSEPAAGNGKERWWRDSDPASDLAAHP